MQFNGVISNASSYPVVSGIRYVHISKILRVLGVKCIDGEIYMVSENTFGLPGFASHQDCLHLGGGLKMVKLHTSHRR